MIDRKNMYFKQVELLVRILPFIAEQTLFAVKGGTAINLFIRDLPRLSVDIDLVYLPVEDRTTSLNKIDEALKKISGDASSAIRGLQIIPSVLSGTGKIIKLMIEFHTVRIKVEVSPVLRGTVFPPETLSVRDKASEFIGYAEAQVASFQDLYAGKICAALDRQHPRDLFDINYLLENEGIDKSLFQAFLIYLISHNRPISELLNPNLKDLSKVFTDELKGMTYDEITLDLLYNTRQKLIDHIHSQLSDSDKRFLLSFKSGEPKWDILNCDIAKKLPGVKWKLQNIRKMNKQKHSEALLQLEKVLNL